MILCQKIVPTVVNSNGRMVGNTYCMQQAGHAGECDKVTIKELSPGSNFVPGIFELGKESNGKVLSPERSTDALFG